MINYHEAGYERLEWQWLTLSELRYSWSSSGSEGLASVSPGEDLISVRPPDYSHQDSSYQSIKMNP